MFVLHVVVLIKYGNTDFVVSYERVKRGKTPDFASARGRHLLARPIFALRFPIKTASLFSVLSE